VSQARNCAEPSDDFSDAGEVYDANGVDRTLVRACLRDTALQRLEALEAVYRLRESARHVGEPVPSSH
jgi:hypothetical protein